MLRALSLRQFLPLRSIIILWCLFLLLWFVIFLLLFEDYFVSFGWFEIPLPDHRFVVRWVLLLFLFLVLFCVIPLYFRQNLFRNKVFLIVKWIDATSFQIQTCLVHA